MTAIQSSQEVVGIEHPKWDDLNAWFQLCRSYGFTPKLVMGYRPVHLVAGRHIGFVREGHGQMRCGGCK